MRAREFIFESDNRSRIEKLVDMIQHPSTEENVRRVAANKLKLLLDKEEPIPEPTVVCDSQDVPEISTNIKNEYLDAIFLGDLSFHDVLSRLASLSPCPVRVEFMRQGQAVMLVKPPFNGQTRQEYFDKIDQCLPGIRRLSADYQLDQGYSILISWI